MNLKGRFSKERQFYFQDPSTVEQLSDALLSWVPRTQKEIIVVCVGTDRSTGDSLGPLTGTLLHNNPLHSLSVYGTLDEPIHAVNLEEKLTDITSKHPNPYIIAVDACLGKPKSIGTILTKLEPLKPGAALNKKLPEVGDIHISGIVNISGYMEYFVLQNTRLHIVMQIAQSISNSLQQLDFALANNQTEFIDKTRYSS
ncbi:spore protease YyaC [Aquibacillus sediminis]|uniref:spore protease YyaC n=1 Tax=Aquibacillus sediminis TaxID=2574734 RepID=UPI001109A9FD|nr:spore protease YyaC [Aquibacillus sediminis]